MNYELAKKLKDAGFPFDWCSAIGIEKHSFEQCNLIPTFSELLNACGNGTIVMRVGNGIVAYNPSKNIFDSSEEKTPEEAVARLWLALNKKSTI